MADFPWQIINGKIYLGDDTNCSIERAANGATDDIKFVSPTYPSGVWLSDLEKRGLDLITLNFDLGPDADVTGAGDYFLKIPIPTLVCGSVTFTKVTVMSLNYDLATTTTTIRASNGLMGSGDSIDVEMRSSAPSNRYALGTGSVAVASGGFLYLHIVAVGGHTNLNVTIRRV